jgi:hypothetical protein
VTATVRIVTKERNQANERAANLAAELAAVTQDRACIKAQLAAAIKAKDTFWRILEAARLEAAMRQREHAAKLADSGSVRALAERVAETARLDRDKARQEADTLRRQVDVLAEVCSCNAWIGKNKVGLPSEWRKWSENEVQYRAAQPAKEGGK